MKISKVTIFKFRSIQEIIFSPKDYTALVGPNNHGKSNVIRALLFFFDEIKLAAEDFLREEQGIQEKKLHGHQNGVWLASTGEFARWWFIPGPEPNKSVIAFRLLESETLWFLIRF